MLRYTLIFLLINSYGRSMGVPLRKGSSNGTILIGSLLSDLSKHCKNEFLLAQIESKHAVCDVEMSYRELPMQCLMFYDANSVLCNVTGDSAAELETDFAAKVNGVQNVTTFCSEAAYFTFPTASYQQMIHFVFKSDIACTKVCTDEDIRTGSTNFFCKYYKWAQSKREPVASSTVVLNPTVKPSGSGMSGAGATEEKNHTSALHVNQGVDGQPTVTSDIAALPKLPTEKNNDLNVHPSEVYKQESSSAVQLTSIQIQESSRMPNEGDNTIKKTTQVTESRKAGEIAADREYQPNPDGQAIVSAGGMRDIAVNKLKTQKQRIHLENDDNTFVEDTEDDAEEEHLDTGGDDGEDQINNEPQLKSEQEGKKTAKQIETQPIYGDGLQRDYTQNTGGFPEDDDHFFPFFLTAVIVVVVLYVLYHNKNKVGKLIFGLIVEGRQPGRRRNSRGHAYRRLDTLEQAMSANTAAPPSKIIY